MDNMLVAQQPLAVFGHVQPTVYQDTTQDPINKYQSSPMSPNGTTKVQRNEEPHESRPRASSAAKDITDIDRSERRNEEPHESRPSSAAKDIADIDRSERQSPTSDCPDGRDGPNWSPSSTLRSSYPQCSISNAVTVDLKTEHDRRRTYFDWPVTFMDPNKLAAAGFFYLRKADLVRCVFCGIEIGKWEVGDDPMRDHLRWMPNCPFLKNQNVGNVSLGEQRTPVHNNTPTSTEPRSYDTCGPYGIEVRPNSGPENGLNKSLAQYGIHKSTGPIHKNFSTLDARLRSFALWPVSLKQKPDVLSDAGFYYTGKGDQTVCFHCGVGLKDWVETDDPWVEHALWASKCTYVILRQGIAFVEKVHAEKQAKLTSKEAEELEDPLIKDEPAKAAEVVEAAAGSPMETEDPGQTQNEGRLCKICYMEELGVLFLPCGHIVACVKCAPSLSACAVCRQPFTATVRAYLP